MAAPREKPFPRRPSARRFPMLRMLKLAAIVLVAALIPAAHAQKEREVSIGLQAAITSIDPHYHNLSPNNSLLLHVFEPLIKRDANQKLVPALATSWRAIDDLKIGRASCRERV